MLHGLERSDNNQYAGIGFKTSDLGGLNYGFELADMPDELTAADETLQTTQAGNGSADKRGDDKVQRTATVTDAQSEQQKAGHGSDLAGSRVTSGATPQTQPPKNPEVVNTTAAGKNQQEKIPERENRKVAAEDATKIANPNDTADDAEKSLTDPGQEAEPGSEVQLAVDGEGDPFCQLPPRAPYQDPPVFKGHTNYGFEFFPSWADIDDPQAQHRRQPDQQKDDESESEKSSCEDD